MTVEMAKKPHWRAKFETTEVKPGPGKPTLDNIFGRAAIIVKTPDDIVFETDTVFGHTSVTLHKEQINEYGGLISGPDSILSKLRGERLVYKWKPTPPTPGQSRG